MKKYLVVVLALVLASVWSAGAFADQLRINGTFPDGRVGIPYLADHLYLTGYPVDTLLGYAQGFYEWQVIDGEVPPGLEFRTAKLYENGVSYSDWEGRLKASLYGTPTQAGTYTFTVFVWDDALGGGAENQAEKTFTITITGTSSTTNTNTNTDTGSTGNTGNTGNTGSTGNTGTTSNTGITGNTGNTTGQTTNNQNTGSSGGGGGGGGGGCNSGLGILSLLAAMFIIKKSA